MDLEIEEELKELIGSVVTVSVSSLGICRNTYHPQISIQGVLEGKEWGFHKNDSSPVMVYRVLLSESTYTYFEAKNVYLINPLVSTGVVIHTRIDTPSEDKL